MVRWSGPGAPELRGSALGHYAREFPATELGRRFRFQRPEGRIDSSDSSLVRSSTSVLRNHIVRNETHGAPAHASSGAAKIRTLGELRHD